MIRKHAFALAFILLTACSHGPMKSRNVASQGKISRTIAADDAYFVSRIAFDDLDTNFKICGIVQGHVECLSEIPDERNEWIIKIPDNIKALNDLKSVFVANQVACVIRQDESAACWGAQSINDYKQRAQAIENFARQTSGDVLRSVIEDGLDCGIKREGIVCASPPGIPFAQVLSQLKNPRSLTIWGYFPAALSDEGFTMNTAWDRYNYKSSKLGIAHIEELSELVPIPPNDFYKTTDRNETLIPSKFYGVRNSKLVLISSAQERTVAGPTHVRNLRLERGFKCQPSLPVGKDFCVCGESDEGLRCYSESGTVGTVIPDDGTYKLSTLRTYVETQYPQHRHVVCTLNGALKCVDADTHKPLETGVYKKPESVPPGFKSNCSVIFNYQDKNHRDVSASEVELWKKGWSTQDVNAQLKVGLNVATSGSHRYNTYPCDMQLAPHKLYCDTTYKFNFGSNDTDKADESPWKSAKFEECSAIIGGDDKNCLIESVTSGYRDLVSKLKNCADATRENFLTGN